MAQESQFLDSQDVQLQNYVAIKPPAVGGEGEKFGARSHDTRFSPRQDQGLGVLAFDLSPLITTNDEHVA